MESELHERLGALLDCAAVSAGPTRWLYLDEALKLRRRLKEIETAIPAPRSQSQRFAKRISPR